MKSTKLPKIPKIPKIPKSQIQYQTTYPDVSNGMFCADSLIFVFCIIVIAFLIYLYHIHLANLKSSQKQHPGFGIDPATYLISKPSQTIVTNSSPLIGLSTRFDVLRDPYIPPVKVDGYVFDSRSSDIRGLPPLIAPIQTTTTLDLVTPLLRSSVTREDVAGRVRPDTSPIVEDTTFLAPVNVETRGINNKYSQVGILTKENKFSKNASKPGCTNCEKDDYMDSNIENKLILPLMGRRHISGRDKWQYYTISNTGNLNTKLPIRSNGRSCTSEYGCDQLMNGDTVFVEGYNHAFRATIYENSVFSYLPW